MDVDYPENNKEFDSNNSFHNVQPTAIEVDDSRGQPTRYDGQGQGQGQEHCGRISTEQDESEFGVDVHVPEITPKTPRSHTYTEYDNDLNPFGPHLRQHQHHHHHPHQYLHQEGTEREITRGSHTTQSLIGPGFTAHHYDNVNVNANADIDTERDIDGAESPDRGLSAADTEFIRARQEPEQIDIGIGGQRRLSIQDLLVKPSPLSTSFSHINTPNGFSNGSPHSGKSTPSPIWPRVSTPASAIPIGHNPSPHRSPRGYTPHEQGSHHQQSTGQHSHSHSPIPFPPPRRERPDPITLRSFPSSSLRTASIRALASPYARPSSSQGLNSLRVDMSVHSATSPVIAAALGMSESSSVSASPAPVLEASQSGNDNGAGLGITSPNGSGSGSGSMSTNIRKKPPVWPSPKKKDGRSYSFNTQSSAQAQTPREWYVKTPTALRVPSTAGIQSSQSQSHSQSQSPAFPTMRHYYEGNGMQSPSTPVSISGQGCHKRPGDGAIHGSGSANSVPTRRVHLTDVPKIQVIKALNTKASEYWYSPETSDCRIYVPIPRKKSPGLKTSKNGNANIPNTDPDTRMADDHVSRSDWPPIPPPGPGDDGGRANVVNSRCRTSGMGRRGSGSGSTASDQDVPVLVFPLHRDYLIIQSNLLRTLFQSTSIQMAFRTSPTRPSFPNGQGHGHGNGNGANNIANASTGGIGRAISPSHSTPQSRQFPHPSSVPRSSSSASNSTTTNPISISNSNLQTNPMLGPPTAGLTPSGSGNRTGNSAPVMSIKGARIVPSREGEPVSIFLPVPDPASFGVVLHWLYWGDVGSLEHVLSRSLVTWQGIVKNIEYLSLDDSIKRVMGKWWRTWVKTDVGRRSQSQTQSHAQSQDQVGSQNQTQTQSRTAGERTRGRAGSSDIESESDNEREREEDGDGMQVDGPDLDLGARVNGVERDDGGVSNLLKNL